MYGRKRVRTCDICGVRGEDVDPVRTEDGTTDLCDGCNKIVLDEDSFGQTDIDADDLVDDLEALLRLQTTKRGRDEWTFEIEEIARDLRVDAETARTTIETIQAADSRFAIFQDHGESPDSVFVARVSEGAA